ncbi:MAG TPA: apolipoprotein N-acyltransferase [Steroidobacteraceae bacterium]|nr:apolipoprotein N-acyltransferase [Steroidobacteraceae bacterium]
MRIAEPAPSFVGRFPGQFPGQSLGRFHVGFGLATLSGCLWFLACTPFDWSAAAWVAAVPMLAAVDRAPTYRQALFLGWWAGVVETAGGFYWLIDTTQRFAGFPWIAGLLVLALFCAARALIFLLFTAVVCAIRRRVAVPMTLIAPVGMAACEFLVPQIFPCGQWITQAWHPLVIQIAELTGPWGVTALLMMVNGAIYDLWASPRSARVAAISAAAILAGALVFGAVRMRQVDALVVHAPRLKVGLVQPNIAYSNDPDFSPEEARRELTALQEESRRLEAAGAELVVWSEGSYPVALPREIYTDFPPDSAAMIRRGLAGPVIIGADTYDSTTADVYNSAILLDREGAMTGRYDKVRLLAFGEYIPGVAWFPWLKQIVPLGSARFTAGAGPAVLKFRDAAGNSWGLGPVICYEDILPDYMVQIGRARPNLLVNMTVDSWYGKRAEPWEHLALAVFATVELRKTMVRAVNSGISALIDPNGRLLVRTAAVDPYREPRPPEGIVVSAPLLEPGDTLFLRLGCWFPYACTAALALMGAIAFKRRRSAPSLGR